MALSGRACSPVWPTRSPVRPTLRRISEGKKVRRELKKISPACVCRLRNVSNSSNPSEHLRKDLPFVSDVDFEDMWTSIWETAMRARVATRESALGATRARAQQIF